MLSVFCAFGALLWCVSFSVSSAAVSARIWPSTPVAVPPFLLHRPPAAHHPRPSFQHYNPHFNPHQQPHHPRPTWPHHPHHPQQHIHVHISRPLQRTTSNQHQPAAQLRIINGALADEFQFPWFASIRSHTADGLQSICGGSVIAADWVLTAAHCTHGYVALSLGFGSTHIDRPHVAMTAAAVIEHPRYNAEYLNYDIAVIRLPERLQWSARVQAIRLPTRRQSAGGYFYTRMARVCGYGRASDESQELSSTLRWVDKRIISNGQCTQTYGPAVVLRSTVCTIGWEFSEQSTCNGDSGGPLVVDEGGIATQIGIVSFVSNQGCGAGYPAGYVRTTAFLDWISAQTGIAIRED